MEFSENNIPESIFLELYVEDLFFSSSYSEPISIFHYESFSKVFSYPVTKIVSEHSTKYCKSYCRKEVATCPKASNQDHDIHSRNSGPNDGERFDTGREKCDEVVPVSYGFDYFSYPDNSSINPFLVSKGYYNNSESKNR